MVKKVNLEEVIVSAAVVKLYEKSELKDVIILETNTYSNMSAFLVKEQDIPLGPKFPDNSITTVLRRYRPGIGQELESIDVYDFLNGVYIVAFKLLKGSKGSPEAIKTFKQFASQRPSITG